MSWSDDDWGKPIFPTRFGSPQGHATERKMLDAVGGFDGIRTKIRTNPDGSTTILKTRGGMPVFTTTPAPVHLVKTPIVLALTSAFYGIPTSVSNPAGYVPTTPYIPDGQFATWDNYHETPGTQPNPFGGSNPVFEQRESTFYARGSTTWYGDVMCGGERVVVGWHHGDVRYGHFTRHPLGNVYYPEDLQYYEWNSFPANNYLLQYGSVSARARFIFIGQYLRVDIGTQYSIDSAALKQTANGYSLFFVDGLSLYESTGWEVCFGTKSDGSKFIKKSLASEDIAAIKSSITLIGSFSVPAPYSNGAFRQAPFFNHDATKAITVADVDYQYSAVIEYDIPTLSAIQKARSYWYIIKPQGTSGDAGYTVNYVHEGGERLVQMLAADYDAATGEPVWLFVDRKHLSNGLQINNTPTTTSGSRPGTMTLSGGGTAKGYGQKVAVKLVHSKYGELVNDTIVDRQTVLQYERTISRSGTITYDQNNQYSSGAFVYSDTEVFSEYVSVGVSNVCLQSGDIRHSTFIVDTFFSEQISTPNTATRDITYTDSGLDVSSRSSFSTTTNYKIKRYIVAFGSLVRTQNSVAETSAYAYPAVSNSMLSDIPLDYKYEKILGTFNSEEIDDSVFHSNGVPVSYITLTVDNQPVRTAQPYTKVAVDPKGRIAYLSGANMRTYHTPISYEAFVFKSGGSVVESQIPDQKYAPGALSTIVQPVFYSENSY